MQDQGQCRFFQWQDELPGQPVAKPAEPAVQLSHVSQQSPQDVLQQFAEPASVAGGSGVFADDDGDDGCKFSFLRVTFATNSIANYMQ